ncbi:MAG TPA: DUF1684 domain-containing protein [Anaeromyxobacter sp.]|nr:DUF1684 domain-containing protein [Anaeromyxobacter sp.]
MTMRPGLAHAALIALLMTPARATDDRAAAFAAWRERREARLREPEGWLALAGLHWLSEGANRVEELPGQFTVRNGRVTLQADPSDGYLLDGRPIAERVLLSDASKRRDRLHVGDRIVQVIERGPALAIRVWDPASPARSAFRGIDTFPYDPLWRIEARWEAYPTPHEVQEPSAAGPPQKAQAPGRVHFQVAGRELSLEPTREDDLLLFVFRDATAPAETYGAGRFLSAELPSQGRVVLDFNRAYNPPCAFTPYATCPLPKPENVLPVRIEAGEKKPTGH